MVLFKVLNQSLYGGAVFQALLFQNPVRVFFHFTTNRMKLCLCICLQLCIKCIALILDLTFNRGLLRLSVGYNRFCG